MNDTLAATASQPRGVRNKNPGNVDYDPRVPWIGQLGAETLADGTRGRFATFDTAEHGIRVIGKILLAYQAYHQLYTLQGMISRWAPAEDSNNPGAYAAAVCATLNRELHPTRTYTVTTPLSLHDPLVLAAVIKGMIRVECDEYEYPPDTLFAGVAGAEPGRM